MNVPRVFWRIVLCDLDGNPLSVLQQLAFGKSFKFPLNRPASLSFTVPSNHPLVNILHTDGEPFLSCGNRTIRAYRRAENVATWSLIFNGIVWTLQDVGDTDRCTTSCTVYDSFQMLTKRLCRDSGGSFANTVIFNNVAAQTIAKTLVNRTITYGGVCGIDTTTGTFTAATAQTLKLTQQLIAPTLISMCDTGLLDVWFEPREAIDGVINVMNAGPRRGQDRANVVLAYAAPGHSAFSIDRTITMDTLANDITLYNGSSTGYAAHLADATSKTKYNAYEDAQVVTGIKNPALLDQLVSEQIDLRKDPRDLMTILPIPERAPMPIRDFFLGDRVEVRCSIGADQEFPSSRQSISGSQRVYGITIDVDDDGIERVSGVDVSPQ